MKKPVLIISLLLIQLILFSQNIFNRIIVDTVPNLTSSVIATDTGYVFLSGTYNEFGIRCFAITYVNTSGQKQWKRIIGNDSIEFWEGFNNSYAQYDNKSYVAGSVKDSESESRGVFFSCFNNQFEEEQTFVVLYDTAWEKGFNMAKSGNFIYLTGQIYDYNLQNYLLLLIKLNIFGNIIWNKTFGNIYESGDQIIVTKDNNVLTGGLTTTSNHNKKWYLLKTDTSGNVIWELAYGHNTYRNGAVNGLIETKDSCYLACGGYPAARYGTGSGEILWDGCLRKINQDGELLWTKYYRTFSKIDNPDMIYLENTLYSMIYKGDDLYILGGNRNYFGASRGYLQKITSDGDICWNRDYFAIDTSSTYQWLVSFQNTIDGGFVMAGYGNEYDRQGLDPPQQSWLVKTDSLGLDGLSNAELPELNMDIELPETICMSDTISVYAYIAGKSAPYTIEISTGQVIDSIYYPPTFVPVEIGLTHVDLQWGGETYFEQTITEATLTNHAWGQCIAKPVEFYTPTTAGLQEIYITVTDAYGESKTITKEVTVSDCGVESILQNQNSRYKIYPNPAKDRVFVNILAYENASYIEILNSAGQVVLTKNLISQETEINIKELAKGSYVVMVYCGNRIENLRFEKL